MIYSADSRLPQYDTPLRKEARRRQTEQCWNLYKWSFDFPDNVKTLTTTNSSTTLPGFLLAPTLTYPSLDINFKVFVERQDATVKFQEEIIGKFQAWYKADKGVIKKIDDFKKLANLLSDTSPESSWLEKWDSDKEFGRQILNGAHLFWWFGESGKSQTSFL